MLDQGQRISVTQAWLPVCLVFLLYIIFFFFFLLISHFEHFVCCFVVNGNVSHAICDPQEAFSSSSFSAGPRQMVNRCQRDVRCETRDLSLFERSRTLWRECFLDLAVTPWFVNSKQKAIKERSWTGWYLEHVLGVGNVHSCSQEERKR